MTTKRILAVSGIGLGVITLGMVWSIVNMALASIQKDLAASILQLQWMMNCFGILLCAPLLAMGKLGDAYGRKSIYLIGLLLACAVSVIAGFTTHLWVLIGCMGLFGLAGSMILPISQALLVHQFPEQEKSKAVAIWSMFASLSLASGPFIGGIILTFLGWRWIYWMNVPIALLALLMVYYFVKHEEQSEAAHCEWSSVGLLALFIATFILPIMQGPIWGWTSFLTLGFFTISLLSLCTLIWTESRSEAPLFRTDLFANRAFLFSAIPNGCTIGFIWVVFFIIPLYLQNVLHFTPLATGSLFLLVTLPVFLFSKIASIGAEKWGYKLFMLIGFILFAAIFLLQTQSTPSLFLLLFSCVFIGFAWVSAWGASMSCALTSIPHRFAGTASGMFTTMQEFSAVTLLSLSGIAFHITQRSQLAPHLNPVRQALDTINPNEFESLVSNPNEVARHLGDSSEVVSWLGGAFVDGYQSIFWLLFGFSLFSIVMTLFIPKRKDA